MVYAGAIARLDRETSWHLFTETLLADISGASSDETQNGIHLGAMASTLHLLQQYYLGLHIRKGNVYLDPSLPSSLNRFGVSVQLRGNDLEIEAIGEHINVIMSSENTPGIAMLLRGYNSLRLSFGDRSWFQMWGHGRALVWERDEKYCFKPTIRQLFGNQSNR